MSSEDHTQGQRLLQAVERILAKPDAIRAQVEASRSRVAARVGGPAGLTAVADELIRHYSLATGVGGGISALPALIPGVGTATAVLGGGLADMTLCLKYEVEMILALASLWGHDLEDPRVRTLCFLMAGLGTHQELAGKNQALDFALLGGQALWQYSPRQAGKLVATVFVRLAVLALSRGALKGIPFAGALIGFAANRSLTRRVGQRAVKDLLAQELSTRGEPAAPTAPPEAPEPAPPVDPAPPAPAPEPSDAVVDAVVDAEVVPTRDEAPPAEPNAEPAPGGDAP